MATATSPASSPVPIQGAKLNGHGGGASLEPNGHASPQLSSSHDRDEDGLGPMEVNGAGGGGLGARRPSQHARAKSDVFGDALDLAEPVSLLAFALREFVAGSLRASISWCSAVLADSDRTIVSAARPTCSRCVAPLSPTH